jgi:uncharacterized protein Yka (UPF0111/DUF47 family)
MTQAEMLQEQAIILRTLAKSIDVPLLRADLLALATRVDAMADEVETESAAFHRSRTEESQQLQSDARSD